MAAPITPYVNMPNDRPGVQRFVKLMIIAEYVAAAVGFAIGLKELYVTYIVGQAVFFVWYAVVEFVLFKQFRPGEFGDAKLKTVGCIRVESLKIPLWFYYYIVFLPNYIHIISTAFTAGSSYAAWWDPSFDQARQQFQKNWDYVPVVGPIIGIMGIPKILTIFLVFSGAGHLACAFLFSDYFWGEALPEICDSGNLLFLGKAFRSELAASDIQANNQLMRLIICVFIKYPFLWIKTSLLAVQYHKMPWEVVCSTFVSIFLAWYGVLQLLPSFFRMAESVSSIRRQFRTVCALLVLLCLGLAHQGIHLWGVFYCTESHDFSILKIFKGKGGC